MSLMVFQGLALFFLIVFTFFISDFRNKKGKTPLVNKKLVLLIKFFYSIPIFIYIYVLFYLTEIYFHSYIGLFLTFIGTFLVTKAKIDLGKYHTWAGHILSSTKMVTHGIYALIRHPLYTGISVFIIGGITVAIKNNPFSLFLTIIILIIIVFLKLFLIFSAKKESIFLQEKFGEIYMKYRNRVHAFLPIRKFNVIKDVNPDLKIIN
jgi:protein-S-isoprenylcysteine O-methyltransferase Ste14